MAFLTERTPHRRKTKDEERIAAALAHELDGLALMFEQGGANIDKLRLSFAEYLDRATDRPSPSEAEPYLRRAAQILTEFTQKTRHEHANLRVVINEYRALLDEKGKTPEQIDQALSTLKKCE